MTRLKSMEDIMKNNSRIRFNTVTKEIEIEGTEEFVKTYFNKLQAMLSGSAEKTVNMGKAAPVKKARKTTKKKSGKKKVTNIDKVLELIKASTEGISTDDLKEKTGLDKRQIWSIVDRAKKDGQIKKAKRGLYSAG
jgi:hypothetical protein